MVDKKRFKVSFHLVGGEIVFCESCKKFVFNPETFDCHSDVLINGVNGNPGYVIPHDKIIFVKFEEVS